jgi:hypothetical protein
MKPRALAAPVLAAALQQCSACHRIYPIRVVDGHVGH